MQIMHDRTAPQIKDILSDSTVAGASALPAPNVCQGMFYGYPLPQLCTSLGCLLACSQLLQQGFIGMNADATPRGARRTALSQRTACTRGHRKFHHPSSSKGMSSPPRHRSSCRCQSSWNALLGKYGPWRTGQALQKMVKFSTRSWTSVLAR